MAEPWQTHPCEHCDGTISPDGYVDDVVGEPGNGKPIRVKVKLPAKSGSHASAPYGWCCLDCEATLKRMGIK